jgi:hypothetical protein
MSALVAKPIGIADAGPAESAAPPRAANPTSACVSFTFTLPGDLFPRPDNIEVPL